MSSVVEKYSGKVTPVGNFWFNDEDTLREAGPKTDAYETSRRMLARGKAADNIDHLLMESREPG